MNSTSVMSYRYYWDENKNIRVPNHYLEIKNMSRLSADELAERGFYPLEESIPEYDKDLFIAIPLEISKNKDVYVQQYKIEPLDDVTLVEKMNKIRGEKIAQILASTNAISAEYMNQFSEIEKATWDKQEAEATAWQNDNSTDTPILDSLAAARGLTREVMLEKAIRKIEMFKTLATQLIGKQQTMEDIITNICEDDSITLAEKITALKAFNCKFTD